MILRSSILENPRYSCRESFMGKLGVLTRRYFKRNRLCHLLAKRVIAGCKSVVDRKALCRFWTYAGIQSEIKALKRLRKL